MTLRFITVILACQLAGEVIRLLFALPVPGPVIGMGLLFAALTVRGSAPEGLRDTARGLLRHLALLFVPAGSGVMLYLPRLADEAAAIAVALVVPTLVTVAVTALVMQRVGGTR